MFEGRLDEAASLCRRLGLVPGAPIAEILAEAYLRRGDDIVEQIRGDYAFVIWDGARRRVLAARDPFGIRPLHYASVGGLLCIASDVDQLLGASVVSTVPDDQVVVEFLTREFRSLARSFFRDVARLAPGHLLVATEGRLQTSDYRKIPETELSFSSTEECHEAFREHFATAVRRRMFAEAPVLIPVSGGIDSTSVICVVQELLQHESHERASAIGVSAMHPGLDCDETPFIDAVAAHVKIPIYRWDGTAADEIEFTHPLLAAPGSRLSWSGGTEGHVAIARSHGARLILDGTGGDQIGMPMGVELDELARPNRWKNVPKHLFPAGLSLTHARNVMRRGLSLASPRWLRRLYHKLRPPEVPVWLAEAVSFRTRTEAPAPEKHSFVSWGQQMRWQVLAGANLAAVVDMKQRHASAVGLEAAFPFLDWDLVRFVLAVPVERWPPLRWLARLHREALRSELPKKVYLRQSKADFTPAMANRVRKNRKMISSLIEGGPFLSGHFVNQNGAVRLLRAFFYEGTGPGQEYRNIHAIWAIASVEAWLRAILSYRTVT